MGLCICSFFSISLEAQKESIIKSSDPGIINSQIELSIHSKYAPFPDSARMNGHDYEGKHFAYSASLISTASFMFYFVL